MKNLGIYAIQTKDTRILSNVIHSYDDESASRFILNELEHIVNVDEIKESFKEIVVEMKIDDLDAFAKTQAREALDFIRNCNFVKVGEIIVDNEVNSPLVNDFNVLLDLKDFKKEIEVL